LTVIPKWRKNTPDDNANDLKKVAVINRLSYEDRITILGEMLGAYDEDSAKEVSKCKSWSELLSEFKVHTQQTTTADKKHLELAKASVNEASLDDLKIIVSDNNLDMGKVDINVCTLKYARAFVKINIHKKIESIGAIASNSQDTDSENYITSLIKNRLRASNAVNLQSGYLYIFLETALEKDKDGNQPYKKLSLHNEYFVTSNKEEYLFTTLNITDYKNIDDRTTINNPGNSIELPACYLDKNKEAQKIDVRVLFSHSQLSGARLDKICNDELKHAKKLNGDNLIKLFKGYYSGDNRMEGRDNINGTNGPLITQAEWDNVDIYPLYSLSRGMKLNLLVDDPVGMLLENNDYINHLKSLIQDLLGDIQNDTNLKSAILAYQIYFNPKAMGIMKVDGLNDMVSLNIKKSLKDTELYDAFINGAWESQEDKHKEIIKKGQSKLDEEKFKKALKYYYRTFVKSLIEKAQSNGVKYLESEDMQLRWQDHFSRGIVDYQSAHSESLALFAPLCSNPSEIDASLNPNLLPEDTVIVKQKTVIGVANIAGVGRALDKVTVTIYSLDGISISKTETIFNNSGNIESQKTTDATSKAKVELKEPAGFKWLDEHVVAKDGELHEMFFPSDGIEDEASKDSTSDDDYYYDLKKIIKKDVDANKNDTGKYNRDFVILGNIAILKNSAEKSNPLTSYMSSLDRLSQ